MTNSEPRQAFTALGYQFTPDKYGWHCEMLGACVQPCVVQGGWKTWRGNYDAVSETEAELMAAVPMAFETPELAAQACVRIWGRP